MEPDSLSEPDQIFHEGDVSLVSALYKALVDLCLPLTYFVLDLLVERVGGGTMRQEVVIYLLAFGENYVRAPSEIARAHEIVQRILRDSFPRLSFAGATMLEAVILSVGCPPHTALVRPFAFRATLDTWR
uniref:Uncharacterized protein n=1 Tax=Marseillevirus LCMAC103 TaxID=2506604 RepID=A0A481YVD8_9VIRU|nr:MAG: hypothetical protein LCMAC103_03440 [Marseillevirus LCMAC103]